MHFKRYDKRYLPMLWTGLAIWLLSILLSAILEWVGTGVEGQDTLMDMGKAMFQRAPYGTLLLLCVLQPIFEEVSFRLWGVGKKGAIIVCLIFMAMFSVSEMGLWGLLFVAAFIAVWRMVKDSFKRNVINTIITSACFALCHVSGFDGFSLGMVLGLLDIFGMAIVMCWLVINLGFWFSALLHVLNNSLALLIPLLFMPNPVSSVHEFKGGVELHTSVTGLDPFADNAALIMDSADNGYLYMLDSTMDGFCLVGEPAELYSEILRYANKEADVFFDWTSVGGSLEERVVYHIKYAKPMISNKEQLATICRSDLEAYLEGSLVLDTAEIDLMSVILVYPDGKELNLNDVDTDDEDWWKASNEVMRSMAGLRGNTLVTEYGEDGTPVNYCILRPNVLNEQMDFLDQLTDQLNGFSIKYEPAKKARMVTVKVKDIKE